MKDIIDNIRLDIKSLLNKRMLFLFIGLLLLYIFFDMGMAFFILPLVFATQPFAQEEYNGIIKHEYNTKRVVSRYIFSLLLLIIIILITLALSVFFTFSLGENINILTLRGNIGMSITYVISIAILYPIYFKKGFRKSNIFLYLIILVYALLVSLNYRIPIIKDIVDYLGKMNLFILVPVFIVIGIIALLISIKLSKKYGEDF